MTKSVTHHARRRRAPRSLREYLSGPPAIGQRALAEAVGCNQSMISMLVRGKRVPSAGLAVKLHAITGVPLKMLLATRMHNVVATQAKRKRATARGDPVPHASPY
jgi:plasmid maintenance system antidote protein VapI